MKEIEKENVDIFPIFDKGLKGIIGNRTCHSIKGDFLEFTSTVPLTETEKGRGLDSNL